MFTVKKAKKHFKGRKFNNFDEEFQFKINKLNFNSLNDGTFSREFRPLDTRFQSSSINRLSHDVNNNLTLNVASNQVLTDGEKGTHINSKSLTLTDSSRWNAKGANQNANAMGENNIEEVAESKLMNKMMIVEESTN